MITKTQALNNNYFHANNYKNSDKTCQRWRRNGATKTWKTRPEEFRVPIKCGLYSFGELTNKNAALFHLPVDCENPVQA